MRMLTDKELAERIYSQLPTLNDGEATSTAKLLKHIKISPEELLPVGDLNGVHYELMNIIKARGKYRTLFGKYSHGSAALPYHMHYLIEKL